MLRGVQGKAYDLESYLPERLVDAERGRQLQLSYKFYEEAYRLSGGYWTGINAATLALLSGRREYARALSICAARARVSE